MQRVRWPAALGTPLAIQRSQAALCRLPRVKQKDIAMHTSIAAVVERPLTRRLLMVTAGWAFGLAATLSARARDTINVRILHSLSGTMAISETTLQDVMLMLIEGQNKEGGLLGGEVKRCVLAGTDYLYPRTTNKILEAFLKQKGVADADIMINYTPFGHSDWQTIVSDIKKFGSAGKKTAVVSTINGDANVPFYKELGNQGIKATDIPVVAFSVGEEELAGIDTKPLLGHLAAWNYFQSIKNPANEKFIKAWQAYTKNPKRVTNDPMEAHVIGFEMWVKAVEKVKSTDADKVIDALPGIEAKNLTGGTSKMLPNHHITKPVFIGEIKGNGQFDVVWKTPGLVAGDAWSKELEGSKDLIGDWVGKKCGNYNTKTNKCGGQGS